MPRNNQETELNKIKIPAYISEPVTNPVEVFHTYACIFRRIPVQHFR